MNRSRVIAVALCVAGLFAVTGTAHAQRGGGGRGGGGYRGGYGYGRGYGYGGFYGGLGLGLGLGLYPYYYGAGPYWYNPIIVAPGYPYAPPAVVVQGQPAPDAPPQTPGEAAPKNAQIKVLVPDAQAKVWFDGNATTSTGTERLFHTPDLTPGATSNYRIRASWVANGKEVVQELIVPVQSGRGSVADFTRPMTERIAPPPK